MMSKGPSCLFQNAAVAWKGQAVREGLAGADTERGATFLSLSFLTHEMWVVLPLHTAAVCPCSTA